MFYLFVDLIPNFWWKEDKYDRFLNDYRNGRSIACDVVGRFSGNFFLGFGCFSFPLSLSSFCLQYNRYSMEQKDHNHAALVSQLPSFVATFCHHFGVSLFSFEPPGAQRRSWITGFDSSNFLQETAVIFPVKLVASYDSYAWCVNIARFDWKEEGGCCFWGASLRMLDFLASIVETSDMCVVTIIALRYVWLALTYGCALIYPHIFQSIWRKM